MTNNPESETVVARSVPSFGNHLTPGDDKVSVTLSDGTTVTDPRDLVDLAYHAMIASAWLGTRLDERGGHNG